MLIAFMYPPDNYSGAARPYRFAKYLERLGSPVTVLAAGTGAKPAVDGSVHRVRGEFEFVRQADFAALVERVARKLLFPNDGGSAWGVRALRYGTRLLRGMAPPVILSTSPPLVTHAVAWRLKKKFGAPWIADFRDPFAGMPWRGSRRARAMDPAFERLIFRNADAVLAKYRRGRRHVAGALSRVPRAHPPGLERLRR